MEALFEMRSRSRIRCRPLGALVGGLRLVVVLLSAYSFDAASSFAVIGFAPQYRWSQIEWESTLQRTTHVVLFSLEPTPKGELNGLEMLEQVLDDSSPLQRARKAALRDSRPVPKLLVAVGGAGSMSEAFAKLVEDKALRTTLATNLVSLMSKHPEIAGVDLDWEAPNSTQNYRYFGKLVTDLRSTFAMAAREKSWTGSREILVTLTYHPLLGSVKLFGGLKGKSSGKSFVDFFDLCHAMAYSKYDREHRHSSWEIAAGSVHEWQAAGLPLSKLTLGLPLFGISKKTGEGFSYAQLVQKYPFLIQSLDIDDGPEDIYFNGPDLLVKKTEMAMTSGLGGVFLWELGQDSRNPEDGSGVLLHHVWNTVQGLPRPTTRNGTFFGLLTDNTIFLILGSIVGAYFSYVTIFSPIPEHLRWAHERLATLPKPKPKPRPAAEPKESSAEKDSSDETVEREFEEGEDADANASNDRSESDRARAKLFEELSAEMAAE